MHSLLLAFAQVCMVIKLVKQHVAFMNLAAASPYPLHLHMFH